VESACARAEGLGLLELDTVFAPRKTLHRVEATVAARGSLCEGCPVIGYEVHQGTSTRRDGAQPWLRLRREPSEEVVEDGAVSDDNRVCGAYVHGLFDDARFCRSLVDALRRRRGLSPLAEGAWQSQHEFLARRHDGLGKWLEDFCDLREVERWLGVG
jgi:adenosylcobyric acid synthase